MSIQTAAFKALSTGSILYFGDQCQNGPQICYVAKSTDTVFKILDSNYRHCSDLERRRLLMGCLLWLKEGYPFMDDIGVGFHFRNDITYQHTISFQCKFVIMLYLGKLIWSESKDVAASLNLMINGELALINKRLIKECRKKMVSESGFQTAGGKQ